MKKTKKDISVIITCYNSSKTLRRAFNSIVEQTILASEIIIIDDCSNDQNKTFNLIKLLYQEYRYLFKIIIIRNNKNQGVANSRNIGWKIAKKTFIAFLDADDTWHPSKLEIQYKFMSSNPRIKFSGHFHASVNEEYSKKTKFENTINVKYSNLLIKNPFITPSVMVRRFVKVRFYKNKRFMEDHLLWIMLGYNSGTVIIPLKLAKIFKRPYGESGLSNNMLAMEKGDLENYLILLKLNYIGPLSFLILSGLSLIKFIKRLFFVLGLKTLQKLKNNER